MSKKNNQQILDFFEVTDEQMAVEIVTNKYNIPSHVEEIDALMKAWAYLIDTQVVWEPRNKHLGRVATRMIYNGTIPKPSYWQ